MPLRRATKVVAIVHLVRIAFRLAWTPYVIADLWNETFVTKDGTRNESHEHLAMELLPWLTNAVLIVVHIVRIVLYTNLLVVTDHRPDVKKTLRVSRYCRYDLTFWAILHSAGLAYLLTGEINSTRAFFCFLNIATHALSLWIVFLYAKRLKERDIQASEQNGKSADFVIIKPKLGK